MNTSSDRSPHVEFSPALKSPKPHRMAAAPHAPAASTARSARSGLWGHTKSLLVLEATSLTELKKPILVLPGCGQAVQTLAEAQALVPGRHSASRNSESTWTPKPRWPPSAMEAWHVKRCAPVCDRVVVRRTSQTAAVSGTDIWVHEARRSCCAETCHMHSQTFLAILRDACGTGSYLLAGGTFSKRLKARLKALRLQI